MKMKTVIKGAFYYDRDSETLLVPHFTGEYAMVDCDSFNKMEELEGRYDQSYIDTVKDSPIEFEGENYYSSEWGPFNVSDDWELLSDISELSFQEENFDF